MDWERKGNLNRDMRNRNKYRARHWNRNLCRNRYRNWSSYRNTTKI